MKIEVLNEGYVRFVEAMGTGDSEQMEAGIIEAARQSTQGNFAGWQYDEKLLAYLWNNKHTTPFEFCQLVLEIRLPIFVARELIRHRTLGFNEMSARYAPLPDRNYIPTKERLFLHQGNTKQSMPLDADVILGSEKAEEWLDAVEGFYQEAEEMYQYGLRNGIPKELARIVLPVGRYTQMRITGNLLNWLKVLILRDSPKAQWEIQQFAKAISQVIEAKFPHTYSLFKREQEAKNKL